MFHDDVVKHEAERASAEERKACLKIVEREILGWLEIEEAARTKKARMAISKGIIPALELVAKRIRERGRK